MAPTLLFDLSTLDLNACVHDVAAIEKINPHRGHMRLVDGVIWENLDNQQMLAFKDVKPDEFWVAGHFPDRPLFPGVLMVEAGAQVASLVFLQCMEDIHFMGFAGVEEVKFRGQVKPGDRLYILCQQIEMRRRRSISQVQGVVDGQLVFEAKVIGMPF